MSLEYVSWAYLLAKRLKGPDHHAREQFFRTSQSIPQNIAEGNGKGTDADRRRFFEIARGSALECAAIQDTLVVCEVLDVSDSEKGKRLLVRIVSMLTKLGKREYSARERIWQIMATTITTTTTTKIETKETCEICILSAYRIN